jgi:hypothetical protein
MGKETVNEMWATIKNGTIWRGILKNKRKDGTPYWVKATVVPIKNKQGDVIEFMSIRNDITEVIRLQEEIEKTQQEVIYYLGEVAESKSKETGNHVKRVAEYSRLLALKYGMDSKEANLIANASPMHDIGKVGIPDYILHKEGKLTEQEWEIMQTHAALGYNVFKNSTHPLLQTAALIALEHHEKYNGKGYPQNLQGENMKDQHTMIKGYRDLSEGEIEAMNESKELASTVGEFIGDLEKIESIDKRWLAIAKTDLQKGFMSLVRSIAQPTSF